MTEEKRELDPMKVWELCYEYAKLKVQNETLELRLKIMEETHETK